MSLPHKIVTVFGSRYPREGSPDYQTARQLGRLLAKAGYAVCCGGYTGIMEAVSRGAREEKGHTIGITVATFPGGPNPYIVEEIQTPNLFARLEQLMSKADAFVVFRGGMGTLAELTLVWNLVQMGQIQTPQPIILFGEFWNRILDSWRKETDIEAQDYQRLKVVNSAEEVIAALQ